MKKDQHLSIVIDAFSRGGAQKVLQLLVPEFLNKYKTVTLFLLQENQFEMQLGELQKLGLKVYRIEAKNILDFRAIVKFLVLITKSKPSHIQANLYWSQIWSALVKFLIPKVRIYWIEHNMYLNRTKMQWFIYKTFSFFIEKVIAVSYEVQEYLLDLGIKKSVVIFNPISSVFTMGIKDLTYPSFLFVGRLNEQKNPDLLLNSFNYAIINNLIPYTSKLSICGEGPLLHSLIEKKDALQDKHSIFFLGYLNEQELSKLYKDSMVLVSTSHYEGFSLVRAEALASGCVIVTTNTSGINGLLTINEISNSPRNGVLVVDSDIKSVAIGMANALSSSFWTHDSVKSRVEITNKLSAKNVAELYVNL